MVRNESPSSEINIPIQQNEAPPPPRPPLPNELVPPPRPPMPNANDTDDEEGIFTSEPGTNRPIHVAAHGLYQEVKQWDHSDNEIIAGKKGSSSLLLFFLLNFFFFLNPNPSSYFLIFVFFLL